MNVRALVLSGAALLAVSTLVATDRAFAQDAAAAPAPRAARQRGNGNQRQQRISPVATAFAAVMPTADQQTKFDALNTKMRTDMTAAMQMQGEVGERNAKMRTINESFRVDTRALLTPDQQPKFDAALLAAQRGPDPVAIIDRAVTLTPEQKPKVEAIIKEAQAELAKLRGDQTLDPAARREKQQAIQTDVKGKIRVLLTPDQQTKFDAIPNIMGGGRGGRGGGRGAGAPAPAPGA